MAGGTARTIALALALCLGGEAVLATQVVDPASARHAITNPAVTATQAQLAALAEDNRATDLAARLDLIANDRAIPAVAQEWLLDGGLHALARLEPTARARETVLRLVERAPVVYARIDPDHGARATPLYDTGATARFVLRQWERQATIRRAQADLATGKTAAVERFIAHPADGIAEAFKSAPLPQLRAQRSAVVDAFAHGRRVDELAHVLADRLADRELYGLVFGYADEPVALAAIASVSRSLDRQSAFEALSLASRRADIASAAVLEIGRLARDDAAARQFLLAALEEADIGPSAAAALAILRDPAVAPELGRRLNGARSEESRRVLVLALQLDAGAAARGELERFSATTTGSAELRREVRQWLER